MANLMPTVDIFRHRDIVYDMLIASRRERKHIFSIMHNVFFGKFVVGFQQFYLGICFWILGCWYFKTLRL